MKSLLRLKDLAVKTMMESRATRMGGWKTSPPGQRRMVITETATVVMFSIICAEAWRRAEGRI